VAGTIATVTTGRAVTVVALAALAACDRGSARARPATEVAPATGGPPVATAPGEPDAAPAPQRPLTAGEIALVRPYFRDAIDYATVRVVHGRYNALHPDQTYMTPRGSIFAPDELFRADFAAADVAPTLQAVFVHEMVHVWQFHSGKDLIAEGVKTFLELRGDYERAYPYRLEPGRDLLDYGMEQQASLVEDWFLIQVHGLAPARLVDGPADPAVRDAGYRAALAALLADPTYARAVSTEDVARRHREAAGAEPAGPAGCAESPEDHSQGHVCAWRFDEHTP
jgi:hypothetical protein